MKLAALRNGDRYTLGVKRGGEVIDIAEALRAFPAAEVPDDPMALIRSGSAGRQALEAYVAALPADGGPFVKPESDAAWGPCVPAPSKIICVGLNYKRHADESGLPYPDAPLLFNKFPNALAANGNAIRIPRTTTQLDYEAELCVVIGRAAANVRAEEALDFVFGYCPANDVSARDLQMRSSQWMIGKTSDGFCPIGPYVVTADEVGDPQALTLETYVNGERRQHSNTKDMIFTVREIVAYVSEHMTLEPGDIILTGTPEGVAYGMPPERRAYLASGDVVRVAIERLGSLENKFV